MSRRTSCRLVIVFVLGLFVGLMLHPPNPRPHATSSALSCPPMKPAVTPAQSLLLSSSPAPTFSPRTNEVVKDREDIVSMATRRAVNRTIFLIPVNDGYIDFGLNLLCSLLKLQLFGLHDARSDPGNGYLFIAMDPIAERRLREMRLPVAVDPDMPFVSSQSAAWADPKFHKLVCTKLVPVTRLLRAGLNVVLSDADIVFRKDPTPYFRSDLDVTFSLGSCHKDLADNYDFSGGDHVAKLNTGFYFAKATLPLVTMMSRALERCRSSDLQGDQPAINDILEDDLRKKQMKYTYGFFDGCLFANGCIYFKHLCANQTVLDPLSPKSLKLKRAGEKIPSGKLGNKVPAGHIRRDEPVLVHANFLVGRKEKVKHLRKYNLWDESCIADWRSRT